MIEPLRPVELTTVHVDRPDQHDAWQQILSRSLYPLRVRPVGDRDAGLDARFRGVTARTLKITRGVIDPVRVETSAAAARAAGGAYLEIAVQLRHPRVVHTPRETVHVPAGRVVLNTSDRATSYEHRHRDEAVMVTMPVAELSVTRAELAAWQLRPLRLPEPILDVVCSAASRFVVPAPEVDAQAAHRYLLAVAELAVRGATGAEVDLQETGPARRRQVIDHMSAQLHRPDLDPQTVAAALRMSRRHLYRLFAGGPGPAETLQELRVQRAHQMLTDPARVDWSVRRIARAVGFSDRSHFSRVFRRHTGRTPSELRPDPGVPDRA